MCIFLALQRVNGLSAPGIYKRKKRKQIGSYMNRMESEDGENFDTFCRLYVDFYFLNVLSQAGSTSMF